MARAKRCLGKSQNGARCKNRGKPEHRGYCHAHRGQSLPSSALSNPSSEERWALLIGAAAALAELTEKAVQYLPGFLDVLVKASHVAFIHKYDLDFQVSEDATKKHHWISSRHRDDLVAELIGMQLAPRTLAKRLASMVKGREWQPLIDHLYYDFDAQVTSGDAPKALLNEIETAKQRVIAELKKHGYCAADYTASRPTIRR